MVQRFALFALSLVLSISLISSISPGSSLAGRSAAEPPVAVDGGWPRVYTTASGARLVLYEPQVASWADQKQIVMYAAVSYSGRDQQTPAFGTLRIEAGTKTSVEDRLVDFAELRITAANFPTLSSDQLTAAVAEIDASVPRDERVIGLDRVLASVAASQVAPRNVPGVKADPPAVFFSTTPAVLVNLDGDPIWSSSRDREVRVALNSTWDLVEHLPSSSYYLRIDTTWLKATSIDGPWTPAGKLPDSFSKLANADRGASRKDARAAAGVGSSSAGRNPAIFVSRKPAELIQLRGAPLYVPVTGTGLVWVSNTDSDLFRAGKTGPVYYLVSGRWFTAPDFKGPWTFATPTLPDDFRKIPLGHPRARVLASVPGTTQAQTAVLLAQVPQTARVSRTEVTAPEVVYQGEPQFQAVEQASVARAVNTDKDVLKVGPAISGGLAHYYLCYDGVWFVSTSATGPWTLAESIPKAIYEIPISSPAYKVTRVTVERADDDAVVYASDAGYTGMMVAWGCAVWGTGWYYPPYVGWGHSGPVYYPRSTSYGYSAAYNPRTGSYARTDVAHGPSVAAGDGARDNQRSEYWRGLASWGLGARVYGRSGTGVIDRGDQGVTASRFTNRATSAMPATQGRGGEGAISRRGPEGGAGIGSGNVFAGHDGNVYRNQGGSWQKYAPGGWSQDGLSAATRDQLDHDFAARQDGNKRMSAPIDRPSRESRTDDRR